MPNDPLVWIIVGGTVLMMMLFATGFVFVVRDTIRGRGRWGVNLNARSVRCPECGAKPPMARVPKNLNQTLWGGWTCQDCGCEYDKWGREVPEDDE